MNGFLTSAMSQAIGWALLHLLWQGVLVAAILKTALLLLSRRSANSRYTAACAALAFLPILFGVTAWQSYEAPHAAATGRVESLRAESLPIDFAKAVTFHATRSSVEAATEVARETLPAVVLAWLAGVAVLSIRLFVSWTRMQELMALAAPAGKAWERSLAAIADALQLERGVRLLESAAVEVPTVIGWLRPVVLLPASSLSGLSPGQIEMLLAHELAHIRRNDFLVNLVQSVVETLMFYHPAVWWISNRVRDEREHCCDDLAVTVCGSPVEYARALTRLEELRSSARLLAVAANGGSLISRIRRILGAPAEVTVASPRWLAGLGILSVLAIVALVPTLPARAEKEGVEQTPPPPLAAPAPPAVPADAAPKARPAGTSVEVTAADEVYGVEPAPEPAEHERSAWLAAALAGATPAPPAPAATVAPAAQPAIPMVTLAPPAPPPPALVFAAASAAPRGDSRPKEFGTSGRLTVEELIELRRAGVTPEYVREMRSAGFGELTLGQIAEMRAVGVTREFLHDVRAAGIEVPSSRSAAEMRAVGVNGEYVKGLRNAGLTGLSARDVVEMRAVGVTPDFVVQMRDAGHKDLTARQLSEMRAVGVTAQFIRGLEEAGYSNLTAKELVRLRASGVNADFIREMSLVRDKAKGGKGKEKN